jgi:hypothetical protein
VSAPPSARFAVRAIASANSGFSEPGRSEKPFWKRLTVSTPAEM